MKLKMPDVLKRFKAVETSIILTQLWWSFVLLFAKDAFSISFAYRMMSQLAEEYFWGIVILAIALIHILGIVISKPLFQKIGLLLSIWLWAMLSILFMVAAPMSTAVGTYMILAGLAVWAYLKVEVGE